MKKVLSAFVLALLLPLTALACGSGGDKNYPGVLGKISDAIDVRGLTGKEQVFLLFGGSLDQINALIEKDVSVRSDSGSKEPIYETLQAATANRNQNTKYVLEISLKDGLYRGHVVKVYNLKQQALQGYSIYKCIGSPLYFEDKVVKML